MTTFDDREQAFENKFAHDQELEFKATARRNRMLGLWAGGLMTLFRVGRCGPGGTSGFDPVPETLGERFRWWTPPARLWAAR